MENVDKEKWMEDVLNSMSGSARAKPRIDLFDNINQQLHLNETQVIPLYQKSLMAAACILLLLLNVVVMNQYVQSSNNTSEEVTYADNSTSSLISNYNIYDNE